MIEGVNPLTESQYTSLRAKPARLPQIRASHHRMAELHALSLTANEIAEITGRSLTDVRNFPKVPANAELISSKQAEILSGDPTDPKTEYLTTLLRIRNRAASKLYDTIDDDSVELPAALLLKVVSDLSDRTGYGRQTTQINLNMDLGERLQRARERQAKARGLVELGPEEFKRRA
jgi:hypothetical protein